MKLKSILIGLILCLIAVYCASCNIQSNGDDTSAPDVGTQDIQSGTSADNGETTAINTEETNEQDEPAVDYPILILKDYEDFLKFGTDGVLDPEKYENADNFLREYRFDEGVFTDCRDLLDLEEISKEGWRHEIHIQERNSYRYIVESVGEDNGYKWEYTIGVKYDEDLLVENQAYGENVVSVTDPAEMNSKTGWCCWRTNGKDLLIEKISDTEYGSVNLYFDHWYVSISWIVRGYYEDGKTPAEIQELLGEKVASLFSADAATIEATLNAIESELNGNG